MQMQARLHHSYGNIALLATLHLHFHCNFASVSERHFRPLLSKRHFVRLFVFASVCRFAFVENKASNSTLWFSMSYGRPPPRIEGMVSLKVDNLTYRTTPEDLRRVFERCGEVGDIYIPRDRFTRESRGFAFVRFYDKRDAEDALDAMDGRMLDGRELRVQMARYGRPTSPHRRYGRSSRRRSRRRSRSRSRHRRSVSRSRSRSDSKSSRGARSRSRSKSDEKRSNNSKSRSRSKS